MPRGGVTPGSAGIFSALSYFVAETPTMLYIFGWSERPFHPNRQYRLSKVAHNMWYTFLGVVQFTIWEVIYMYCCATKRIQYLSDQQVTSSYWNLIMFCLVAFWVPLYKDFHFYFTHR